MKKFLSAWMGTTAALFLPAALASVAWSADPVALQARVTDQAGLLSDSAIRAIESVSERLEQETRVQLAVLTVPDLGGRSVEEFALKTAELTKLGQKKQDNGVLLLIARSERAMRIEVGYGLEGKLTDVASSRIIRNVIVPEFRAGRFDSGVVNAAQAIADRVRDPKAADAREAAQDFRRPARVHSFSLLVFILFAIFFMAISSRQNRSRIRRRGGWWIGPPSGGGFGGFGGSGGGGGFSGGGGSFGGGGASGRW